MSDAATQTFADRLLALQTRAARARRGALVGAGVGVVVGVVGLLLLDLIPTTDRLDDLLQLGWSALEVGAAACFGAGAGHLIVGRGLTGSLTDELGYGPEARQLKNEIRGKQPALDAEQVQRAARYAAVAAVALPAQTARLLFLWTGILLNQLAQLVSNAQSGQSGPRLGFSLVVTALTVALVALFALQARTARQARVYSRTHPVEETVTGDLGSTES